NKITTPPHNDTTTEMNSRIRVPRLCGSVPDGSPSAALVMSACNAFLSAMMSHLFGPTHPEQVRSTGRDVRLLAGYIHQIRQVKCRPESNSKIQSSPCIRLVQLLPE